MYQNFNQNRKEISEPVYVWDRGLITRDVPFIDFSWDFLNFFFRSDLPIPGLTDSSVVVFSSEDYNTTRELLCICFDPRNDF